MTALVQKNRGWLLWSTVDDAICVMPQSLALSTCTANKTDEAAWLCGQSQDDYNRLYRGVCQITFSVGIPTLCTKIAIK